MLTDSPQAIFGEVRAICLGAPTWHPAQCRRLLQWLGRAHRLNAALYHEQFVPYLSAVARQVPTVSFATVSSTEELEWVATLLPGAVFTVSADAEFDFKALGRSWARVWVRGLELHRSRFSGAQAATLFEDLGLERLKILKCFQVQDAHRPRSTATVVALIQSAARVALERFELWAETCDMELAWGICDHVPRGLERLLLYNITMPPSCWQALMEGGRLAGVVRLELPSCGLSTESLGVVLEAESFKETRHLSLYSNLRLGTQAQRLVCEVGPGRWHTLDLSHTQMRDAPGFGQAAGFTNLEVLTLQYGQFGPQESVWELAPLCFCEHFPRLRELNLGFTHGLVWTELLKMVDHFGGIEEGLVGRVEVLRLWGCVMDARAMPEVAAVTLGPVLHTLDLSHCVIAAREAAGLAGMRAFKGVNEVVLSRRDVSSEAIEILEAAVWGDKIRWEQG